MCRQYLAFLVTSILLVNTLQAQLLSGHSVVLKGQLLNDSTNQPIPFAHLFNESNRIGSISDERGNFSLLADPGDTLIFSALGYLSKVIYISDSMLTSECNLTLQPVRFKIEEVSVLAFRDYEHFKKAFIDLQLPETQTKLLRNSLAKLSIKEALEGDEEGDVRRSQLQPNIKYVHGNVPIYSKDDLMRMNYEQILVQESRQRVIDEKYNREILYEITNLQGDDLTDFMSFCNFSKVFLSEASPYEIVVKIMEKFEEYKLCKGSGILIEPVEQETNWSLT